MELTPHEIRTLISQMSRTFSEWVRPGFMPQAEPSRSAVYERLDRMRKLATSLPEDEAGA